MKIALCISGLSRTFDECFPFINENIILANPDIQFDMFGYINSKDISTASDGTIFKKKDINFENYTFTNLQIESDPSLPDLSYQKSVHTLTLKPTLESNIYYQLYGGKKSNQLRLDYENQMGFKYDFIAKIRTDMNFLSPVNLSNLEKDCIYIPNGNDHYGLNDRFAIGDDKNMNTYFNRYNFFMNRHDDILNYTTHAESNLKMYLNYESVKVKRLDFSYSLRRPGFDVGVYLSQTKQ
jgi:hypothetical protein